MHKKLEKVLHNQGDNYIFPFLWLHGEDEKTLRKYMKVICEANIRAVCVESRPHPDYCGPRWWKDMDILLDEAQKRGMKIWILDDAHFPTGYANGAVEKEPEEKHRQVICCRKWDCDGLKELRLDRKEILCPPPFEPTEVEKIVAQMNGQEYDRHYDDDQFLGIFGVNLEDPSGQMADLTDRISDPFVFRVPEGRWRVYALYLTRNAGFHRNYINMLDKDSCRILLDAVYEPHYQHYGKYFGSTIAGFFSDEPELGNGHLYDPDAKPGVAENLPWSRELGECLAAVWGEGFPANLIYLWENEGTDSVKAQARYDYMDQMTRLVEKNFSIQIGDWCRAHHVQYIGHIIEDNNQHARTGSSLGHYFRGLAGQDMAGIDDIGGQVLPQGENLDYNNGPFSLRQGEFYHYMLGTLASSLASVDPVKQGRSVCEIFGNYGWSEGVRLEKYLVDHFLSRGINHFVPHAFSPKEYPDPDCPPHFYANGNNPQYRHFGALMAYTNRVCELISGGRHMAAAAVLYHAEGEWTSGEKAMPSHRVGRILSEAQIEYDYIPCDVFSETEKYQTRSENGCLVVNRQKYSTVIVPASDYITVSCAEWLCRLQANGAAVYFAERQPEGCVGEDPEAFCDRLERIPTVQVNSLVSQMTAQGQVPQKIDPADSYIRIYSYQYTDGTQILLLVNEGTEIYSGKVKFGECRSRYLYDPWNNQVFPVGVSDSPAIVLEPLKSMVLVEDRTLDQTEEKIGEDFSKEILPSGKKEIAPAAKWVRSICRSIEYPMFREMKEISLPDHLAEEEPEFSGFVRYENKLVCDPEKEICLEITDAHEGVEVFVNGKSLEIQIAPPFRYRLMPLIQPGENRIAIEVATTLEREMSTVPDPYGQRPDPQSLSGITGDIHFWVEEENEIIK